MTPEEFRKERDIDLRTGHKVIDIDPNERVVTARSANGETVLGYDSLLIATGAKAVTPSIDGLNRKGVYTLGSMSDGKELR